ncbi:MAG: phosphoribosyltransferase [Clostridiales bacterium]|nr:phosphoribosyltransferase [Eubacteriales bacterium]MDH7565148.1 phosphoribosyltransferase [Clostridiales bacterium]
MGTRVEKLVKWLFSTKAVKVCPQDKPYWYTSGTIGPYYINTHFLYGSEEKANELLNLIDSIKTDKYGCPLKLLELVRENYGRDEIYRGLIDEMYGFITEALPVGDIDYISGGERRDWFFSLILADRLGKPHITLYKDLSAVVSTGKEVEKGMPDLEGKRVLHIADLITEASSYERAWIPAIEALNGKICWSAVVVDRKQGGEEYLRSRDIHLFSMIQVDESLFDHALSLGLINDDQYLLISEYIKNPKESMKKFLLEHPHFLRDALNSDEKTKERATLCLEKNFYNVII